MKLATRYLVLLTLLAVGCGDSNEGEGGGDDPPKSSALACDAVSWCTSYSADPEPVKDPPAMTGGTLGDGLYRMEFGQDDAQAMLIQGKSVLWVREPWVNRLGTWKVESGRLVISLERRCTPTQDEADTETLHLAFGFKGNVLYTQELDFEDMPVLAWRKVESLCEENDSFTCRVTPCACEFVTNKPLSGQSRCR